MNSTLAILPAFKSYSNSTFLEICPALPKMKTVFIENSIQEYSSPTIASALLSLALAARGAGQPIGVDRRLLLGLGLLAAPTIVKTALHSYNSVEGWCGKTASFFRKGIEKSELLIYSAWLLYLGSLMGRTAAKLESANPRNRITCISASLFLTQNIENKIVQFPILLVALMAVDRLNRVLPPGLLAGFVAGSVTVQILKDKLTPENFKLKEAISFFADPLNQHLQTIEDRWNSGALRKDIIEEALYAGGAGTAYASFFRLFGPLDPSLPNIALKMSAIGAVSGALQIRVVKEGIKELKEIALFAYEQLENLGAFISETLTKEKKEAANLQ